MARVPTLGDTIIVAESAGDRPAIITKVFTATSVEACMFAPMPEYVKVASIHADPREARNAALHSSGYHAYWKA